VHDGLMKHLIPGSVEKEYKELQSILFKLLSQAIGLGKGSVKS